jgi:hypothetical protein
VYNSPLSPEAAWRAVRALHHFDLELPSDLEAQMEAMGLGARAASVVIPPGYSREEAWAVNEALGDDVFGEDVLEQLPAVTVH